MKPQRVDLSAVQDVGEVVRRVVATRKSEVRALATALDGRERRALHDFRIATKRLRYALERFTSIEPPFEGVAEKAASLQDALGEAHDRDVLLAVLPPNMPATERRLAKERESFVDRAAQLWHELDQSMQALDSLIRSE